jgi:hypothetical protein
VTHIYLLTILDGSDFDKVCYQSAHPTRRAAEAHGTTQLAEVGAATEAEWRASIRMEIESIAYIGDAQ